MSPASADRRPTMTSPPALTGLLTVAVPVSDQDAAQRVFSELGFTTELDSELAPGFRWLEMSAPDGTSRLSFVRAREGLPAGIDTGIRLATTDARAARDRLAELGAQVGELLDWETAPLMFSFTDVDGNRFYVTETG